MTRKITIFVVILTILALIITIFYKSLFFFCIVIGLFVSAVIYVIWFYEKPQIQGYPPYDVSKDLCITVTVPVFLPYINGLINYSHPFPDINSYPQVTYARTQSLSQCVDITIEDSLIDTTELSY